MGSGRYSIINSTVCNIRPKVHTITIDYNDNGKLFNLSSPKFVNGADPIDSEDSPWLGNFALSVFQKGLTFGQSTNRNGMGDIVVSFMSTLPDTTDLLTNVLVSF